MKKKSNKTANAGQRTREEMMENINKLYVATYLDILGYVCLQNFNGYVSYVSPIPNMEISIRHADNTFCFGKYSGGILDLASAFFDRTKCEILENIALYRIDTLLTKCGDRNGALWTPEC